MVSVKRSFSPAFQPCFVVWSNRKGCHGKVIKTDYGPSNREGTLILFFLSLSCRFSFMIFIRQETSILDQSRGAAWWGWMQGVACEAHPTGSTKAEDFRADVPQVSDKKPELEMIQEICEIEIKLVEHTQWDLYENQFSSEKVRIPQFSGHSYMSTCHVCVGSDEACADYVVVSRIQWKQFGLPPSSIHKLTGLGGKMEWIMMYSYRPNWCWSVFLCLVDLKISEGKKNMINYAEIPLFFAFSIKGIFTGRFGHWSMLTKWVRLPWLKITLRTNTHLSPGSRHKFY